jgi:hypothetical protein
MRLSQEQRKRYSDACYQVHGLSQEQQKRHSDACHQVHGIGWVELVVSCWTALITPFAGASDRTTSIRRPSAPNQEVKPRVALLKVEKALMVESVEEM